MSRSVQPSTPHDGPVELLLLVSAEPVADVVVSAEAEVAESSVLEDAEPVVLEVGGPGGGIIMVSPGRPISQTSSTQI